MLKLLKRDKKIDTVKYRRLMLQFFDIREWGAKNTITRIEATKLKSGKINVEIETHQPGILIGKGGNFIDGLEKFLRDESGEDIKILIKECKMWHKLYEPIYTHTK